jgi:hypothetical protein
MKLGLHLLAAASAVLISGCAYNTVYETKPNPANFAGLGESLGKTKRLNLLAVHGMLTHHPGYSDTWTTAISQKLGLSPDKAFNNKTVGIVRKKDGVRLGYLKVGQFTAGKGTLRVYEVTWSPATVPLKTLAFAYDDAHSIPRNGVNKKLKKLLINDAFGDAVQYMGDSALRDAMQYPVETSLCLITNDAALDAVAPGGDVDHCEFKPGFDPDFGFAVLTHSLGSTILFDVIDKLSGPSSGSLSALGSGMAVQKVETKAAVTQLRNNTYHVFMMANQLPLLHLAANKICIPPKQQERSPMPFANLQMGTIVAFNDPNDLLSYPISDCQREAEPRITFVDVEISVAKWALYVPGYGTASHPLNAHVGYYSDDRVISLIACGSTEKCVDGTVKR